MAPFRKRPYRKKTTVYRKKTTYRKKGMTATAVKKIVASSLTRMAEKKKSLQVLYNDPFGQINNDGAGYLSLDITPELTLGTSNNNDRIGKKVSYTGFHIQTQFLEQSASRVACDIKYMVVLQKNVCSTDNYATGNSENPIEKMFYNNSFIRTSAGADAGIKDYSSMRNQNHFKDYQILRQGKIRFAPDQISSTSNRLKTTSMGIKFRKPFITTYGDDNKALDHRFIMVVFASSGNNGGLASSLTNVPITNAFSGYQFSMEMASYYTDV